MNEAPAPAKKVYLHIGTMKSGTTFVQQVLARHRGLLAEAGVLYPGGESPAAAWSYARQVAAVRDALELPGPLSPAELDGAWRALAAEVNEWDGPDAIVSVEQLSIARRPQIKKIVSDLGAAEAHVVLTARDLGRVVPSSWQETIQNGLTWTWAEFADSVLMARADMGPPAQRFWRQHDLVDIVDRWASAVDPSRIHVVTVPPAGSPPGQLWRRFCQPVGLDATRYPLDAPAPANTSLDRQAVELLRQLNLRVADRLDAGEYVRFVKRPVAKRAFADLPPGAPMELSPEQLTWAARHGEEVVVALQERGVSVVGDLRDLVTAEPRTTDDSSPDAPAGATSARAGTATAATVAAVALMKELAEISPAVRAARAGKRIPRRPAAQPAGGEQG